MFDSDGQRVFDDEEYGPRRESSIGSKILKIFVMLILAVIALPALLVGALHFFGLFAKGAKQRVSTIAPIVIIELLILIPLALHAGFIKIFKALLAGHPMSAITSYLLWCAILGIIGGFFLIATQALKFRMKPSSMASDGWRYNFTYNDSPWVLIKKKILAKELREGKVYDTEGSPVGLLDEPIAKREKEIDDNKQGLRVYDPQIVYRSYRDAVRQTIVSGQTGSGKTQALLSLIYNDVLAGIPLVYVDFKKSADVLYFLSKWAKENDREFYYFTNGDGQENAFYGQQATYDPLSNGDQTSKADFILNLREWDAAADVYKQRTQEILQGVLYALQEVPHDKAPKIDWNSGHLKQLISALDLTNMYDLVNYLSIELQNNRLNSTQSMRVQNFISNYQDMTEKSSPSGKALREQLAGIKTVINKLIMSSYGQWLMEGNSPKHIDLLKIVNDYHTNGKAPICLFAFSAQEEPDFAKSMGQVIMSDLNRVSAAKTGMNDKNRFGVYVDEFQTLNPKFIADLLAKARSAGFFITIASQSLEQISAAATENPEAVLQSILDVCGNYLFLKGAKQDSAERMAKIMGQTKHIIRHSSSKSDNGLFSINPFNNGNNLIQQAVQDDWVLSPSAFQDLKDAGATNGQYSEAYFISTSVDDRTQRKENAAQKVRIIVPPELLAGPSDDFLEFIKQQTYNHLSASLNQPQQKSNPFASLKTAKRIPTPSDEKEIEQEINSEFEVIQDSQSEVNQQLKKQPLPLLPTSNNPIKRRQVQHPVTGYDPAFDDPSQAPKLDDNKPKAMTTFEKLKMQNSQSEVNQQPKKQPLPLLPTSNNPIKRRQVHHTVTGYDPAFDDPSQAPKLDDKPKAMTTFEKLKMQNSQSSKPKKKENNLSPRDEPEVFSHSIERIPEEKKQTGGFKLPKL